MYWPSKWPPRTTRPSPSAGSETTGPRSAGLMPTTQTRVNHPFETETPEWGAKNRVHLPIYRLGTHLTRCRLPLSRGVWQDALLAERHSILVGMERYIRP